MPKAVIQGISQQHGNPLAVGLLFGHCLMCWSRERMQGEAFLQGFPPDRAVVERENVNGESQ